MMYILSAQFQLENLSAPAWLGLARNLHSSNSSLLSRHGLWTHDDQIPNSLRPKLKSQSQISICDFDIKASFFVEVMVD